MGKLDVFENKLQAYQQQILKLKEQVSVKKGMTFSMVMFRNGQMSYVRELGALWQVLIDVGMQPSKPAGYKYPTNVIPLSSEALLDIDADIIFQLYPTEKQTPESDIAEANAIFPNYCHFLEGCRNGGRFMSPQSEVLEVSFHGLYKMMEFISPIIVSVASRNNGQ